MSSTFRYTRVGLVLLAAFIAGCGGSSRTSTGNGGSSNSTRPSVTTAPAATAQPESSTTNGSAGGAGSAAGAAITSVVFSGTTLNPTVTVSGSGLGQLPAPNPTYTPEGTNLCPLPPSANQGYDYGTSFYLFDTSRNWAGGRYRPNLNELDCIGLIESKFTPSQVVFTFGSAYSQYQQKDNYLLAEGDSYELAVNGAVFRGTVHYTT
ncbi:MAG TPA: hypothetical protein VFZ97_04890 [Acidimicrobiales bacterium]